MNYEVYKNDVGLRLKQLRLSRHLSQKTLCDIFSKRFNLSTSERSLRRYEDGENLPSTEVLFAYKEVFNVSFDYLLNGSSVSDDDSYTFADSFKRLNRLLFSTVLLHEKVTDQNDPMFGKYIFLAPDDETTAYLDKLLGSLAVSNVQFANDDSNGTITIQDFDKNISEINLPNKQIKADKERLIYISKILNDDFSEYEKRRLSKLTNHRKQYPK